MIRVMTGLFIEEKFLKNIKNYNLLTHEDKVVLGVSGGSDSMCLLEMLSKNAKMLGISVYAVHINHMLRGEEADKDEQHVKDFCEFRGIKFFSKKIDVCEYGKKYGMSIEEAAREVRYEEFEKCLTKFNANKIVVAHNRNDQAETVLMRIIRGTGLDGLTGMEFQNKNIIRPFLNIDKTEIERYCEEKGIIYRTDSSNFDCKFTRNKIRKNLIPYIDNQFGVDIINRVNSMISLLKEDKSILKENLDKIYRECPILRTENGLGIKKNDLEKFSIEIQKRILRKLLSEVKKDLKNIQKKHIDYIINFIEKGGTGVRINLPDGLVVKLVYGSIWISTGSEKAFGKYETILSVPGKTKIDCLNVIIETEVLEYVDSLPINVSQNHPVQYLDYDKFEHDIIIRNRIEGDRIFLNNLGKKKLKKYFIDCKMPKEMREKVPLLTMNGEVVWIVGYRLDERYRATEKTKKVLKVTVSDDLRKEDFNEI